MDFTYVYANKELDEIHGIAQQPLIGMNTRSLFASAYEGGAALPLGMIKALDTQEEVPLGIQTYVDKRFGPRVVEVTCIYLQENHVACITKASHEAESLTQELSIQKQMLEHGEKAGKLCTWIVNQETGETSFTQSYYDIHHFQEGEINAQTATAESIARIHPEDQEKMEAFRSTKHGTFPVSASYRYRVKEDKYIWLEDTISQRLPDGKLIGITEDITESRKQELKLRELNEELAAATEELQVAHEEVLRSSSVMEEKSSQLEKALKFQEKVMETSPEIIYVYDLQERRNVFANKSLFAELGYTEADVQALGDQLFQSTIHPEDLTRVFKHHGSVLPHLTDGEVVTLIYRMYNQEKKQYVWLESTESIFEQDEQGKVRTIIGIARNINEQKQVELALLKTTKELEELVYSVSHDLRAPVRHIEAYADQIQEEEASQLSEEGKVLLDRVDYSAKRLGGMIDELLVYARNRNSQPQKAWIDTNKLLTGILEEFKKSHVEQSITWDLEGLPRCYADPDMMRQVWENLISNAVKYSSKKEETFIRVQSEEKEKEIIFSIHDRGAGFNQAYADKLFAVFQRLHTRREFPGHGIGLANVARMIDAHKGRIWGEGRPGEGASFYVSLPKYEEEGG